MSIWLESQQRARSDDSHLAGGARYSVHEWQQYLTYMIAGPGSSAPPQWVGWSTRLLGAHLLKAFFLKMIDFPLKNE